MWQQRKISSFDGTQLAVQFTSRRDRQCILVNGLGGRMTAFDRLVEEIAEDWQCISWDYRGLFESGEPLDSEAFRIEDHARDAKRVLGSMRAKKAVFIGWSMGVQIAIECYRQFPERFLGIVLLNGLEGHLVDTFAPHPSLRKPLIHLVRKMDRHPDWITRGMKEIAGAKWLPYLIPYIGIIRKNEDIYLKLMQDYLKYDMSNFFQLLLKSNEHTAEDVLPTIRVPSLVIAGEKDTVSRCSLVKAMAAKIPHARFHIVKNATHYALLEYPEEVLEEVQRLLKRVSRFERK